MAAPLAGGIFTSFVLELVVYLAIYEIWKWHGVTRFRARAHAMRAYTHVAHPLQRDASHLRKHARPHVSH